MPSPSPYNKSSKRLHPPPAPSAFFASSQAARASSRSPPSLSSPPSSTSQQQAITSDNLQYLTSRPEAERQASVSSASSSSSTASSTSSSGISSPVSPRTFSPASLSSQQATVEAYRNRYAAYLAATWGISPEAAGVEFEHHLHTRPGQHWPQPDRH